jgi:hypothetical protein
VEEGESGRTSTVVEAVGEDPAVGKDPTVVGEAVGKVPTVDLTAVGEVTAVQAWRHAVEERARGWRGNNSS